MLGGARVRCILKVDLTFRPPMGALPFTSLETKYFTEPKKIHM